jgi:chromosome partitioning protein
VVALLAEASMVKPNRKASFVISRKIVNTALARDVPATLGGYRISTLAALLAQWVAFAESLGSGLTVFDMDPFSAAGGEVAALTKEGMEFAHGQESLGGAAPAADDSRRIRSA